MVHEGQTLVCLRDPEGYVEEPALLSPPAFLVASFLDGQNTITDIQYHFVNHSGGTVLATEDIEQVVEFLDQHGFLQTERFEEIQAAVRDAFAASTTRPAAFAGQAYPDDAAELRAFLDKLLTCNAAPSEKAVRALVVPHIDFERGGPGYAHGYAQLTAGPPPDAALVFGVVHAGSPMPCALTKKPYATPLAVVPTDTGAVDALAAACAWDPYDDEIAHRTEHSIEFQAVVLAHLFGDRVPMVPVLCGAFVDESATGDPEFRHGVAEFLDACRRWVQNSGKRVVVIAAGDLAHVGRRFGDDIEIDDGVLAGIEARDREDLACVTRLDADGFYRGVMRDGNARRVCGHNCIYAALKAVEGTVQAGALLHYGSAPDPAGGVVSYAAAALYET